MSLTSHLTKLFSYISLFGLCGLACAQAGSYPDHLQGDLGVGVYASKTNVAGQNTETTLLPYGFFDYQRFFYRIDTLGLKVTPIGYGHLELAARVNVDDQRIRTQASGPSVTKNTPAPVGIGSMQITPIGAFYINIFRDLNKSNGMLYEALYFGEIDAKKFSVYPQIGIEHMSKQYANNYYGLTASEASSLNETSYNAGASTNPILGLMLEVPLTDHYIVNFYGKRKWLSHEISSSPVLKSNHQDLFFMALAYRFK